jgi:hypothetical protein
MTRYKKASDSQWPGFPNLQLNDIETLTIRQNKYVAEALVNNRKGRIILLMEQKLYQDFLAKVRERKGDIRARYVNEAVLEAVQAWMKKKET